MRTQRGRKPRNRANQRGHRTRHGTSPSVSSVCCTVRENDGSLAGAVDHGSADERLPAVFDWLHSWFSEPDYRGWAFINSYGELGATSPQVAHAVRAHKEAFQRYVAGLVSTAGRPASLADHLCLLAEGAITTAAIHGTPEPARQARAAARLLIDAARDATTRPKEQP
ncbi:MAG: hypothetical protein QOF98_3302 [Streptomyces sp.]|nr:hypothetical protein [Streptomyces sp.]